MIQPSFVSHETTGIGGGATARGVSGTDAHAAHMMTRTHPTVARIFRLRMRLPPSRVTLRRTAVASAEAGRWTTPGLQTRPACRIKVHTSHPSRLESRQTLGRLVDSFLHFRDTDSGAVWHRNRAAR